jgi:hypothetical protein
MKLSRQLLFILLVLLIVVSICDSATRRRKVPTSKVKNKIQRVYKTHQKLQKLPKLKNQKQMLYETRETSPPNFVTLFFMRLVYGIASTMGIEDRLPGFVAPPNADEGDFFSLGTGGGGGGITNIFSGGDDYDLDF